MTGLLGLGGLGGMTDSSALQGLLGDAYDPQAMKRLALKQALATAGMNMMGKQNFGEALSAGLGGAAQGFMGAQQNYLSQISSGLQLQGQLADARKRKREEDRNERYYEWLDATKALLPPKERELADIFPDKFADLYLRQNFPHLEEVKPTDDMREYQAAQQQGFKGTLEDWILGTKRAGAPQTNIDLKGQSAYAQERGKGFAMRANEIDQAEASAIKSLSALGVMDKAMADPAFYSGWGANQLATARKALVAIGGDPDQVSSMETFSAQAKQVALDAMGGSLGTGFSNADRDFVEGQVPNLANTPQGNKQLIEVSRRIAKRKVEIARLARKYENEHGQLDTGFFQELSTWSEQNPLFVTQAAAPSNALPQQSQPKDGGWSIQKVQ